MNKIHPSHGVIVDDDRVNLDMVAFLLHRTGFERIARFPDAEEALAYVLENGADLIISDFEMAPMNGLAFLRAVRRDPRLRSVPFLMLTASLDETSWKLSIEAGATEFLFKPLSANGFREAVATCLDLATLARRPIHEFAPPGRVATLDSPGPTAATSSKRGPDQWRGTAKEDLSSQRR